LRSYFIFLFFFCLAADFANKDEYYIIIAALLLLWPSYIKLLMVIVQGQKWPTFNKNGLHSEP